MTLVSALVPQQDFRVGDLRWWCGAFAVSGEIIVKPNWLGCNGALVSTTTYAKLFAELGFAYSPTPGVDPGSGQFYLPDFTDGRVFVPRGVTRFPTRGLKGGAKTVALASDGSQDVPHLHGVRNTNGSDGGGPEVGAKTNSQEATGAYIGPSMHYGSNYYGASADPNNSGLGGLVSTLTGLINSRAGGVPTAHQNMPPVRVIGGMIILYQ